MSLWLLSPHWPLTLSIWESTLCKFLLWIICGMFLWNVNFSDLSQHECLREWALACFLQWHAPLLPISCARVLFFFFFCHTELVAVLYYLCCVDMAPSTQKIHLKISFVCLENSFILKISSHSSLSLSFSSLRKLSPTYQLKYISPLVRFHWILNTLFL